MTGRLSDRSLNPVARWVRSLPQECYLATEVADALGVVVGTIRRLGREHPQELGPSYRGYKGEQPVYLYTPEDVERLRVYLEKVATVMPFRQAGQRGRPQLWTDEQRIQRQRAWCQVGALRRKATMLRLAGHLEDADQREAKARALATDLNRTAQARRAELAALDSIAVTAACRGGQDEVKEVATS